MRKLWIAGLVVASLTGITFAQVERPDPSELRRVGAQYEALRQRLDELNSLPKTCIDEAGAVRKLGDTMPLGRNQIQCVPTFGDGLNLVSA